MFVKRSIPQEELERVAGAGVELVDIAKALASLLSQIENPTVRSQLELETGRVLDVAEKVSSAARSAAYAS
jgi:hypothetical protein